MGVIKLEKLTGHSDSGKITRIYVSPGDTVKKGDKLLDIESKKGSVSTTAGFQCEIKDVLVEVGASISIGEPLFKIPAGAENVKEKKKAGKAKTGSASSYFGNMLKPKKEKIEADIAIIGGGPGGYVAALQAGLLGKKVVLIEKNKLGGTCLNEGCIPTKTLVRSAEVFHLVREAEKMGIGVENVAVDLKGVMKRKNEIVGQLVSGIDFLLKKRNVKVVKGMGDLIDKNTVMVKEGLNETTIHAENIIIATGGKVSQLNIPGSNSKNIITSKEALELKEMPGKMIIIGGGIIGMEFAFIYASFGVQVTVVEYADSILNTIDKDVVEVILQSAKEKGIRVISNGAVTEILDGEDNESIVKVKIGEEKRYFSADKVLIAVGRDTCFEGIDHEKVGLVLNEYGNGIEVNEFMQTNIPNIYAIGDVTRKMLLAHVASHQGVVAVKHIAGEEEAMNYSVVPNVVFTMPEIATAGYSESELEGRNIKVSKFPFEANGKALALGDSMGFVKLIEDIDEKKLVGAVIVGPHASDMITEAALCIRNGLGSREIIKTIHAHPTTAEAIHEAALGLNGGALHFE